MALSDVIKKKQETAKSDDKPKEKVRILDDLRVVIVILSLVCVALIILIVVGFKSADKTLVEIDSAVSQFNDNQAAIENLHALQSRSSEYKAKRDEYQAMIANEPLDQQKIMIDMEDSIESYQLELDDIKFGELVSVEGVNQIPVTVNVTGSYSNIMKFAYDTVNAEQIKRIDSIKVVPKSAKDDKTCKSAEITVVLFSKK